MGRVKRALITGITGQDGSYLAEFLLKKKYKVYGFVRRVALEDETHRLWRIKSLLNKKEKKPFTTDLQYFLRSIFNIEISSMVLSSTTLDVVKSETKNSDVTLHFK